MFQDEDDSNASVTETPEAENCQKPKRKHGKKRRREDSPNLREGRNDSTEQSMTDIQQSHFASLHSTLSNDGFIDWSTVPQTSAASLRAGLPNPLIGPSFNLSNLGLQLQTSDRLSESLAQRLSQTNSLMNPFESPHRYLTATDLLHLEQERIMRAYTNADFTGISQTTAASFLLAGNSFDPMLSANEGISQAAAASFLLAGNSFDTMPSANQQLNAGSGRLVPDFSAQLAQFSNHQHAQLADSAEAHTWNSEERTSASSEKLSKLSNRVSNKFAIPTPSNIHGEESLTQEHSRSDGLILYTAEDQDQLNENQIFLRQQLEVFRATEDYLNSRTHGKSRRIELRQVGIRCRHCCHFPIAMRNKGSTYFPSNLMSIYQAAQNVSVEHLQSGLCHALPLDIKDRFARFVPRKLLSSGAGKKYWVLEGSNVRSHYHSINSLSLRL